MDNLKDKVNIILLIRTKYILVSFMKIILQVMVLCYMKIKQSTKENLLMVKWKVKELKLGQMETNMKECGTMTFNMALVYFILLRQTKKPLKNGEKANAGPGTKLPN